MIRYIVVLISFYFINLNAQVPILSDEGSLVTGVWQVNGSFDTLSSEVPYEGVAHYRFIYSIPEFWAGIGLNLDNWNSSDNADFSGYTHLSIAYRGLSEDVNLTIALRSDDETGNTINVGGPSDSYQVVEIPLLSLSAGTSVNLSSISEVNISTTSNAAASGTVFIDDLKLINKSVTSGTSQQTWSRFLRLQKGFNFSNWLEAYWLIEFDAYPEVTKFTRNDVEELAALGFNSMRLPVTFEQIAGNNPPYTLDTSSLPFSLIDSTIAWAEDYDLPLIITNHHGYELTDENFADELPRIRKVWEQVRARYKDLDPEKYFFELSNEPTNAISNANFRRVADSLIKDFRSEGLQHSLIVGGNGYNSAVGLLNTVPYEDEDIIYTFHSYDPYFFTHQQMSWTTPAFLPPRSFPASPSEIQELQGQIQSMRQWSQTYNLPVFMGEFGASSEAENDDRCNYITTIAEALFDYNMPYFYWDATTANNAFGFIENGNADDCFAQALQLENFNACNLVVTQTADVGPGSLRNALNCSKEGDTIRIDPSLSGANIDLKLPTIFVNKSIIIEQTAGNPTTLTTLDDRTLIAVNPGETLTLRNVDLQQNGTSEQPAMVIKGNVVIENVALRKN